MRRLFLLFNRNMLLKMASWNSIFILVRITLGAVMSNLLARFVGDAGLGYLGNLRNFSQGLQSLSVLGLENGLTKNAAALKNEPKLLSKTFTTAWIATFIVSVLTAIGINFTASWLSLYLFDSDSYSFVLRIFGCSLPFYFVFVAVSSLLQGFEWFKTYVVLNIIVALSVFVLGAYLIVNENLYGALLSIAVTPYVQFILALLVYFFYLKGKKGVLTFSIEWSNEQALQLFKYSVMALVSAILIPLVNIEVRNEVIDQVSDHAAGWWESVQRISGYYMVFVTTLISLYVLPNLSKDSSFKQYRSTIWNFYKTILPLVVAGLISVYFCRDLILEYLFTTEFLPASSMFKWQLLGDFIKVITTVMAFRFIALNDLKRYLVAELISIFCFYLFTMVLLPYYGKNAVVMAYFLNYIFYFLILILLLRKELFGSLEQ
ncbi:LPS biosynthesis protein WzxE [Nonlabens tegetincola]|nr:LPS biosynthesis protein WzxE [Nonlabens tegetincola]